MYARRARRTNTTDNRYWPRDVRTLPVTRRTPPYFRVRASSCRITATAWVHIIMPSCTERSNARIHFCVVPYGGNTRAAIVILTRGTSEHGKSKIKVIYFRKAARRLSWIIIKKTNSAARVVKVELCFRPRARRGDGSHPAGTATGAGRVAAGENLYYSPCSCPRNEYLTTGNYVANEVDEAQRG